FDEIAIENGFYNKHYLSAGALGMGVLSTFSAPYHLSEISGFLIGLIFPTGAFETIQEKLAAPIQGAIAGGAYGGNFGALGGLAAGAIDETLMHFNITNKPYLANSLFAIVLVSPAHSFAKNKLQKYPHLLAIVSMPFLKESVGAAIGAIYSMNSEDQKITSAMTLAKDLSPILKKISNEQHIDAIIDKFGISVISTQVLGSKVGLFLAGIFTDLFHDLEAFEHENPHNLPNFNKDLKILTVFLFPYMGQFLFASVVNDFYTKELTYLIQNDMREQYFSKEILLKLSQDPSFEVLVDNIDRHVETIAKSGSTLILSSVKLQVDGMFNIGFLSSAKALDLAVYLLSYNKVTESISIHLTKLQKSYNEPLRNINSKISTLDKELKKNAALVEKSGQGAFLISKLQHFIDEQREISEKISYTTHFINSWFSVKRAADFLFTFFVIGNQVSSKKIEYKNRLKVNDASSSVTMMASWSGTNAADIEEVKQSLAQIEEFLNKSRANLYGSENSITYETTIGLDTAIELEDFVYGYKNKNTGELVTLGANKSFTIPKGIYAIAGESGSGKSTFLSKIQRMTNNGIWAQGKIRYLTTHGDEPNIFAVSQDDYLPPYTTLLEFITLNNRLLQQSPEQIRATVIHLLKEIKIDDKVGVAGEAQGLLGKLDSEDWKNASPGQRKKLMVLKTILAHSEIVIMDEVFNGLDTTSTLNVQAMLKKYLPNTLFLIVDHHYNDNNHQNFYDKILYLSNQTFSFL
ncbi:MAG: ATP-binding cassette domain-containing protein, partial [Silvanigrellaceae bacterium]|nr:ATP-binding cassette domain-containing protein [Silvanigrellaceae bacterium]